MPDWLIAVFVMLLLIVIVVALVLSLSQTEPETEVHQPKRQAENWQVTQQTETPWSQQKKVVVRPIVLRPKPAVIIKRKQIQAKEPPPLPHRKMPPPISRNNNGGKIGNKRKKVNLDTICPLYGRSRRVCGCNKCQQERENFGN